MARKVLTATPAVRLEPLEAPPEKKVITPLKRILMEAGINRLLQFLHQLNLEYALSKDKSGHYHFILFADGLPRYKGGSLKSPGAAIADVLLTSRQEDYHRFLSKQEEDDDEAAS